MAEYIEREALEIALNHRLNFLMAENGEYDHYTSGFDEAVTRVENFPAADVEPVKRGRWIKESDGGTRCSACNKRVRDVTGGLDEPVDLSDMPYCPKCGARMNEEGTHER